MTPASDAGKKLRLLYMASWPMNERDWRRFGVSHFTDAGHHVEIADLSDCVYPSLEKSRDEEIRSPDTPVHHFSGFRSLFQLSGMFGRFDAVVSLLQPAHLMQTTFIPYFLLGRSGRPYVVAGPAVLPGALFDAEAAPFHHRLRDFFTRVRKANLLNSVIARLPASWLGVRPAAVVLRPSEKSRIAPAFIGPETRILRSCTDDYEAAGRLRNQVKERKTQAVFVDQNVPYHADWAALNVTWADAEQYYSGLCAYFDRFEAATGLQIVIAAHPKSSFDSTKDIFAGRTVVKNRTAETIAESRVVIGHASTALGLAAALRLPVVLLATKPLYDIHMYEKYYYEAFARELGAPLIFIDDPQTAPVPALSDLTVNEDLYAAYERRYLRCEGAPETPRWAAVESALYEVLAARAA